MDCDATLHCPCKRCRGTRNKQTQRYRERIRSIPEPEDNWRDRAQCIGEDPELFFPPRQGRKRARDTAAPALKFCARCPVQDSCLFEALRFGDSGVWGGTIEAERRAMGIEIDVQLGTRR